MFDPKIRSVLKLMRKQWSDFYFFQNFHSKFRDFSTFLVLLHFQYIFGLKKYHKIVFFLSTPITYLCTYNCPKLIIFVIILAPPPPIWNSGSALAYSPFISTIFGLNNINLIVIKVVKMFRILKKKRQINIIYSNKCAIQ